MTTTDITGVGTHAALPARGPLDLLQEATGPDFEDIAALTVVNYGYIRALQPGGLQGVNAFRRDYRQPRDRRDLPQPVCQHLEQARRLPGVMADGASSGGSL